MVRASPAAPRRVAYNTCWRSELLLPTYSSAPSLAKKAVDARAFRQLVDQFRRQMRAAAWAPPAATVRPPRPSTCAGMLAAQLDPKIAQHLGIAQGAMPRIAAAGRGVPSPHRDCGARARETSGATVSPCTARSRAKSHIRAREIRGAETNSRSARCAPRTARLAAFRSTVAPGLQSAARRAPSHC